MRVCSTPTYRARCIRALHAVAAPSPPAPPPSPPPPVRLGGWGITAHDTAQQIVGYHTSLRGEGGKGLGHNSCASTLIRWLVSLPVGSCNEQGRLLTRHAVQDASCCMGWPAWAGLRRAPCFLLWSRTPAGRAAACPAGLLRAQIVSQSPYCSPQIRPPCTGQAASCQARCWCALLV